MTNWRSPVLPPDLMLFKQCLQLAQQAAAAWGGKLLVVKLPSYAEVTGQEPEALSHRTVVEIVADIGLPLIDGAALFRSHADPVGLFALRTGYHPNEEGHALLARRILRNSSDPRTAPRRRSLINIAQRCNSQDLITRVQAVFHQVFGETVDFNASMVRVDEPQWTSLRHVEFIIALEREFGLRFDGADATDMTGIPMIVKRIEQRLR